MESFQKWLHKTRASEIPITKPIIIDTEKDLPSALYTLLCKNIRSAPVWSNEENAFIGVLDVRNIMKLCFENVFVEMKSSPRLWEYSSNLGFLSAGVVIQIGIAIALNVNIFLCLLLDTIFTCIIFFNSIRKFLIPLYSIQFSQRLEYITRMQKFKTHPPDVNLLTLLRTLSNGQHVVGILESEKEPENPSNIRTIVTQGVLMKAVLEKWPKDLSLRAKDVAPLKTPVCINQKASAKEAFQEMAHRNLSCLAVVKYSHPARTLVNQISTRDISGLLLRGVDHHLGVNKYLAQARRTPFQDISVSPEDSFEKVKDHFRTGFHHIWVISRTGHAMSRKDFSIRGEVTGVISMTDVFRYLRRKCSEHLSPQLAPVRREINERPPSEELTPIEFMGTREKKRKGTPRAMQSVPPLTPMQRRDSWPAYYTHYTEKLRLRHVAEFPSRHRGQTF